MPFPPHRPDKPKQCRFGSPISHTMNGLNAFIDRINKKLGKGNEIMINSYQDILENFYIPFNNSGNISDASPEVRAIFNIIDRTYYDKQDYYNSTAGYKYDNADSRHFVVRTCNSYWNPQVTIRDTNVDPFYLGMASQAVEREDTIITPDLRGKVFGPLDFSRRDLMAINMQRARDHGLPDFNSARQAYGLPRIQNFEDLNPLYGILDDVTRSIENLREVYNDNIDLCDIWACGLAETIPSGSNDLIPADENGYTPPPGPGELFSEVLFDQFMRIRHGDRFWYENYENNGILTETEFKAISKLTIKKIITLVTNISDDDISDTPFQINTDTVCPQPFQLSELYMDDCTDLKDFDYYYNNSVWQAPVIWGAAFLYVGLVIMLLFMMAAYNQYRREKVIAAGHSRRPKKIDGTDVTSGDGEVLVAYELKAGLKCETRTVSMKFGPGKCIVLFSGEQVYREVDLRFQTEIKLRRPFNNDRLFCVRIPHEYDIILQCHTPIDRTVFLDKIQGYLSDIGIGVVIEEPLKRQLLKEAYTKRQRQKLLENFFKSVFHEGGSDRLEVGENRKDILECELSRGEFADAMSLKKDSLFVEQMYQLIDQDGNGFISFREFLDMIVIFAKGSPDDKIKLMFEMYDVDKSGQLSRAEFCKMLRAMMELVNASVSASEMDQLIDSMFTSAGFQNKQELTLEDFNVLLRDHKHELSSAHLKVSGVDVEVPEKASASTSAESETLPSRYRTRETATARARRTVIKAYGRTTKGDPRERDSVSASTDDTEARNIPLVRRSYTNTKVGRYFAIFIRIIENYKLHIFWLSIFYFACAGIFVERAYYYSIEREFAGLRRIAGYGITVTRGAASGMMFTYSVLLITMARNFITYLRETIFNNYIPFDSYISFHKIVALTALGFTLVHCIGHGLNFYHISTQTANDLTCLFREVYHRSHVLPQFTYWLFLTMTGFASFILTLVTVIIFVFATQYARRYTFQAFWITHHFYIAFYILMFLHGSGRLVQDPLFGNFFLGPGIIYTIDLIISISRRKQELTVIRADILPSLVIGIYFKRPLSFDYKPGQWVKIASAAQNPGEFHSFTISSAPHEDYLSLHIRAVGPWTYNFRDHYNPIHLRGQPYPKVFIDGPFGEGHQDWTQYEVSVLVGGGIGVTPFASILKELVHRFNIGARVECKKVRSLYYACCVFKCFYSIPFFIYNFNQVFFIWVTRSQKQWEWFTDIIRDVEEADTKGLVESHIFVTQFFDKFDLRTTMLVGESGKLWRRTESKFRSLHTIFILYMYIPIPLSYAVHL